MNVTMEMPDEFIDQIIEEILLSSYRYIKDDINRLKKRKKLKDYEKEDLADNEKLLEAMKLVGNYYVWNFKDKV